MQLYFVESAAAAAVEKNPLMCSKNEIEWEQSGIVYGLHKFTDI